MRPLELDFLRARRQLGTPVWVLLLGALVAVAVADRYLALTATVAAREGQVAQLQRELAQRSSPLRSAGAARAERARATDADLKQAAAVSERLSLPWDRLLRGIERTALKRGKDVALLAIRPDAHRRMVKITGEARDFPALVAYAQLLAQDPSMDDVYIESHQVMQQDPQRPVRFELAAHWQVTP